MQLVSIKSPWDFVKPKDKIPDEYFTSDMNEEIMKLIGSTVQRLEHHERLEPLWKAIWISFLGDPSADPSLLFHEWLMLCTLDYRFLNIPELSPGFVIWHWTLCLRRQKEKSEVITQFIQIWTYCRKVTLNPAFLLFHKYYHNQLGIVDTVTHLLFYTEQAQLPLI